MHGNRDPLWVGRNARTVTKQQWLALVQRDRHCVVTGCARRPVGCAAHHVEHWLDGGLTNMDNLVLLCEQHRTSTTTAAATSPTATAPGG